MSPAQSHYFKLLDAAQANWEGTFPRIKEAADASDIAIKLASPVIRRVLGQLKRGKMPNAEAMDAIRQGVKSGQIDMASLPELLQSQLKSKAAKSPTKALLAAGGLGGLGGYLAGKRSGEASSGKVQLPGWRRYCHRSSSSFYS